MKLLATPRFIADVEDCAEYLHSEASGAVAEGWRQSLKQAVRLIAEVPEIGRVRQDLPQPGIRTLNLRKYPAYLIFYRIEGKRIELLRVRHGMMHLPGLFPENAEGE
ncbi:MAG: type II toxin-antitoxin system RelE/ParE family toxin [Verrucomicrobia bacterium]|nr:type II toxin-antitoxin system RelE/ParE family toxin [Verrucomicrobiota bacterium]